MIKDIDELMVDLKYCLSELRSDEKLRASIGDTINQKLVHTDEFDYDEFK